MRLHQFDQVDQRFPAHDAVGVQDDEIAVALAPGAEKIADVAALLSLVDHAAAVINAAQRVQIVDQIKPPPFLLDPFVRIGGIAQDVEIETIQQAGFLQGMVGGAQSFADARRLVHCEWEKPAPCWRPGCFGRDNLSGG